MDSNAAQVDTPEREAEISPNQNSDSENPFLLKERYEVFQVGKPDTLTYRILFLDYSGSEISPLHEISLHYKDQLRYVCTTPRDSTSVYQFDVNEDIPTLRSGMQNGKLKSFSRAAKWNVGYLPQTWADPSTPLKGERKGLTYDGQPLQAIEISSSSAVFGEVRLLVPVLSIAVIQGSTFSWHVVGIDAREYQNDHDCMCKMLEELGEIKEWLKSCLTDDSHSVSRSVRQAYFFPQGSINYVLTEANSSWKSLVEAKNQCMEKSNQMFHYGHSVWANYVSHISKSQNFSTKTTITLNSISDCVWEDANKTDLFDPNNLQLHLNIKSKSASFPTGHVVPTFFRSIGIPCRGKTDSPKINRSSPSMRRSLRIIHSSFSINSPSPAFSWRNFLSPNYSPIPLLLKTYVNSKPIDDEKKISVEISVDTEIDIVGDKHDICFNGCFGLFR